MLPLGGKEVSAKEEKETPFLNKCKSYVESIDESLNKLNTRLGQKIDKLKDISNQKTSEINKIERRMENRFIRSIMKQHFNSKLNKIQYEITVLNDIISNIQKCKKPLEEFLHPHKTKPEISDSILQDISNQNLLPINSKNNESKIEKIKHSEIEKRAGRALVNLEDASSKPAVEPHTKLNEIKSYLDISKTIKMQKTNNTGGRGI